MQLSYLIPNAHSLPLRDFIKAVNSQAPLGAAMEPISKYYTKQLPMWQVLTYFCEPVSPDDTELQISCPFPEHGTSDVHKSARYYCFSRDGDEAEASVFCHKCQKRRTSLWTVHEILSADQNDLAHTFETIENLFKVPFPRDVILDLDTDDLYSLDPNGAPRMDTVNAMYSRAVNLMETRPPHDDAQAFQLYRDEVFALADSRI